MEMDHENLKFSNCLFLLFCAVFFTVFIPRAAGSQETFQHDSPSEGGFYFRENHGYYDTMIGDIRAPVNTLGFYIDDPVPHTRSERPGHHRFFDATFGETFYLLGYDYVQENSTAEMDFLEGVAGFLEGSAHLLLDFDGPSNDVINTDYRIGLGLSGRGLPRVFPGINSYIRGLSWDQHISWRLKAFHESTHLGDEYSIAAVRARDVIGDPAFQDFRRINVSYEALEIFIGLDDKWSPSGMFLLPEYGRIYGGYRYVEGPGYTVDEPVSLSTDINSDEFQTGGELYFRIAQTGSGKNGSQKFLKIFFLPQFLFVAADVFKREQYDYLGGLNDPRQWSYNIVAGIMYGDPFKDKGKGTHTLRYTVNYYDGLNPHGQFRNSEIQYVGFHIVFDFR